jgi:hypothetical protein
MLVAGAAAVFALGIGGGVAIAQDDPDAWPGPPAGAGPHGDVDRDARHEEMRAQMPDELREQCDERHAQMGDHPMGDHPMGEHMGPGAGPPAAEGDA